MGFPTPTAQVLEWYALYWAYLVTSMSEAKYFTETRTVTLPSLRLRMSSALSPHLIALYRILNNPRRGNESVVFKQESKSIFDLSRRLADEFAGARRLRMPVDFNPEDRIVLYPYFRDTLLDLMRADPAFPPTELKKILRYVGEAIQEFHAKSWLHLGTPTPTPTPSTARILVLKFSNHLNSWQI